MKYLLLLLILIIFCFACHHKYYGDYYDYYFSKNEIISVTDSIYLKWKVPCEKSEKFLEYRLTEYWQRNQFYKNELPTIDKENNEIYFISNGFFEALNYDTGEKKWSVYLDQLKTELQYKIYETNSDYYITGGRKIIAIDKTKKSLKWIKEAAALNTTFNNLFYVFRNDSIVLFNPIDFEEIKKIDTNPISHFRIFNDNLFFIYEINDDKRYIEKFTFGNPEDSFGKIEGYSFKFIDNKLLSFDYDKTKNDMCFCKIFDPENFDFKKDIVVENLTPDLFFYTNNNIIFKSDEQENNKAIIKSFNLETNKINWVIDLTNDLMQTSKFLYRLTLHDHALIVVGITLSGMRHQLFAFNPENGELLYKIIMPGGIIKYQISKENLLIQTAEGWLYSIAVNNKNF